MSKIWVEIGSDAFESDAWVASELVPAFQAALDRAFPEHDVELEFQRNISPLFKVTVGGPEDDSEIKETAREIFSTVHAGLMGV